MEIRAVREVEDKGWGMRVDEFDYKLPRELIAQEPAKPRDHSRLMVVDRISGKIIHDYFYNLTKYLRPDDLVVFNDTRVFPARLLGRKESGGRVEILVLNPATGEFLGRNIGGAKRVIFDMGLVGTIANNRIIFNIDNNELLRIINRIGYTPLPPYIRPRGSTSDPKLRRMYQTVYAQKLGSAAAPTAGLHFTKKLMKKIPNKTFVTLHVGLGTFGPVRSENIEEHKMHVEYFRIDQETITKIQSAKRVVAVGTTSVRVLESDWKRNETDIFIYPGYKFRVVDAMITNFHLPKSTLLMLVSAFAGRELVMRAYAEAIREKYRFFSFGDAMLIGSIIDV